MRAPHPDRVRMRGQAFGLRKAFNRFCNSLQTWRRQLLDRNDLYKIENAQASAKTRLSAGGEHVTGTRGIVAGCLRRVVADKYRSGVPDERYIVFVDGDVLRREKIGPFARLIARCSQQD